MPRGSAMTSGIGFTGGSGAALMDEPEQIPRWTLAEIAGLLICILAFFLIRLPLLTPPGLLLGWHSDAALLGLMARAITEGDIPWLFWGADYLAPLTSLFAALVGMILRSEVGPLELRIGVSVEILAALLFFYAGLRITAGRRAAMVATLWLTAGPAFLFKLGYAPLSAEQYFFLGAIVFWYVTRFRFTRPCHWLILGLLTGAGLWIHRGVLFVVVPALIVIVWYDLRLMKWWRIAACAAVFAVAVPLGYIPAMIGKLAIDQRLYAPVKPPWSLAHVQRRFLETVTNDVWWFVGAESNASRWILGAVLVVLLALAIWNFRPARSAVFAAGVVGISFAFWILSTDAHRGAVRYIMIALPIVYTFASAEIIRLWDRGRPDARFIAVLATIVITASVFIPRHRQVRDVAAALLEQHENWPGGFDPRPALGVIRRDGYRVCYADVWIAHKLEFLSDSGVRFIPHRSVNRRMVESLRLGALPGPKCFVDLKGNVRTLSPGEETKLRLDTLWHMHGGFGSRAQRGTSGTTALH
jgi:hypothetical protein